MSLKSPLRVLAVAVGLLTASAAGLLWWQADRAQDQLRAQILAQAEQRSVQLADAMAGQVAGFFANADQSLQRLRSVWIEDRARLDEIVRAVLGSFPEGSASLFSVTGADGYLVYDSRGGNDRMYVGDRDHFKVMRSEEDRLVIGKPVLSRISGQWAFVVGRPILRDGRFEGTVQLLVSSDYMAAKLAGLELSTRDVVALAYADDGTFMARSRDNRKAMGTGVPKDRPFLRPDAPDSGIFRVAGLLDGTERTYGWHLAREYGLVVAIGLDDEAVFAPLASGLSLTRGTSAALAVLVMVGGVVVMLLLLRLAGKQQQLAANEERFRTLAELSSDWYWEQDAEYRFIQLDDPGIAPRRRAQAFVGMRRWELEGVNLTPGQWAEHRAVIERHEVFHNFEYQRAGTDGKLRWASISGAPVFDGAGRFAGYRGVGRDITDWKQAQQQLADSEATLRLVVDNAPMMIAFYDAALNCRFSNRAYAGFRGLSADAVIGKPMQEIISGESWREFRARLPLLQSGETTRYRTRRAAADGRQVFLDVTLVPYVPAGGVMQGAFVLLQDITEQAQAEEQLRNSEARFRSLTDLSSDWYWEQDEQFRFRELGDAGLRVDLHARNPVGKARWELDNTNLSPAQWAEHRALLERHESFRDFEFMRVAADGTQRWVCISGGPIFNERGDFTGYRGVGKDITAARQADAARRTSEERLRATLDNTPGVAVQWFDREGRVLYWNPASERLYGIAAAHAVGRTMLELLHTPEQYRGFVEMIAGIEASGTPVGPEEIEIRSINGVEATVLYTMFKLPGAPENPVFVCMDVDVSERKRAEQALRGSEARFRSVFEQAAVGMTLRALDGHWIAINEVFGKMLGYTLDDLEAGVRINHPEDHDAAAERLRALSQGELESYQHEKRYVAKDGRVIWVDFWASVVHDEERRPVMRLAVAQDITARKCAEEELRVLNAELERRVTERTAELAAANRELETFAYSVSHDLKAPLRGIDGYSRLLLEDHAAALGEEGQRFLHNVRQGARNMNELIEDLLAYSRIERGGRAAELLELKPLVQALVAELAADPAAGHCRVDSSVPVLRATADREGLTLAVRNLLDNAVKFTVRTPQARIEAGGRDGDGSCILWVRDNGPGFDMKYHDRIFGIFERLHRTEDYPGTGVGLAIVQKAMARMGGRVWAESAPGQGATFYLEIPK